MNKLIIVIFIILTVILFGYLSSERLSKFEHHGIEDMFHHSAGDSIVATANIDTTHFVLVHASLKDVDPFFTSKRITELVSFPCQKCHNESLENLQMLQAHNAKKAHWDVEIIHAGSEVMTCSTCHNRNNLTTLQSLSGESIHIDESFKLCGQCHSSQYKDWQGGAHGKDIGGWRKPRISETCVNCHNPHNPSIEHRWPSRLNKQTNFLPVKLDKHDF